MTVTAESIAPDCVTVSSANRHVLLSVDHDGTDSYYPTGAVECNLRTDDWLQTARAPACSMVYHVLCPHADRPGTIIELIESTHLHNTLYKWDDAVGRSPHQWDIMANSVVPIDRVRRIIVVVSRLASARHDLANAFEIAFFFGASGVGKTYLASKQTDTRLAVLETDSMDTVIPDDEATQVNLVVVGNRNAHHQRDYSMLCDRLSAQGHAVVRCDFYDGIADYLRKTILTDQLLLSPLVDLIASYSV